MDENEIENKDLPELICTQDYLENQLNVLPGKMMLVACCNHPEVCDGIFISLDNDNDNNDYGSIYYHYESWNHPHKFAGTYFDDKEKEILNRYGVTHMDELDEEAPEGMRAMYELHKLPFVKIADSFTGFLNMCRVEDEG